MNTDERETAAALAVPPALAPAERWRALSEHLAVEIEAARAEAEGARADADRSRARLRELHARYTEIQLSAWLAERDRQHQNLALATARDHITRTQPLLRSMRTVLALVQDSKFWILRNRWFALKKRLKPSAPGPLPRFVPDLDDVDDRMMRQLPYERWMLAHAFRDSDRRRLAEMIGVLPSRPTFSILMPTYETPERYLRAAIESVIHQVYPFWELCIADDASKEPHVRAIIEEYAAVDPRIKPLFRAENGHISASSNSALSIATGEFVVLFDHDDALSPDALFENALVINHRPDVDVIYSDEDKIDEDGRRSLPYFKPDWSPESLLSRNYISHLGVYRRTVLNDVGGFRLGFEGSQDYDLLLRVTERTERVEHIPRVLYHWRVHSGSTAATRGQKNYALDAGSLALAEALERRGEPGRVVHDEVRSGLYTIRFEIRRAGKVSIIMPTRDHGDDVDLCLASIFEKSTYEDIEIVLLDNGSRDPESLRVFGKWLEREPRRVKVVHHDVPFNFSAINNYAVGHSSGDYVLFLNNDTEVITPDWLEAMIEQAQRPAIGAVGAKLLYGDGTVQHAGVIVGLGGVAGHSHKHFGGDEPGYFYTLQTTNNFSAVTAACMMVRRSVFDETGGFDEGIAIAFNDVDFCLRLRQTGYRNVYLPHVVLYHHESKSRGYEDTAEKQARFLREQLIMHERWKTDRVPDPYYNVNLSRDSEDYAIGI
jgi:O-antigen biosynthesis protein